jgi:hypothetical protein
VGFGAENSLQEPITTANALTGGSYVSFFYEEKEGDQFSLWPKFLQRNYFF